MAERTAAEKMRLQGGMSAAVLHVPEELDETLGIPDDVVRLKEAAGADFILDFAVDQAQAEERLRALQPHIGTKTIAWIGYPKGSRSAGYDVSRDTIAEFVRTIGLVVNASVAIDPRWSALRMRPL